MKKLHLIFGFIALTSQAHDGLVLPMKYIRISGTFLKFENGQRVEIGDSYCSQEKRLEHQEILMRTHGSGKVVETRFALTGPKLLDFKATSDDPKIPVMTGHFLNSDYEEAVMSTALPEQKLSIHGVTTKIDPSHFISTKTLINDLGQTVGVIQERVEYISEEDFNIAINVK